MKITRRLLPIILILAMLALILVSCTNASSMDPTLVTQSTLTPLPSLTATIAPTATITPEPTRAPAEVADGLGLRSGPLYEDRSFTIEERNGTTYLVDTYNDAPKAVLEGGAWRALDYTNAEDAETMYGALVPEGGEYILPSMLISSRGPEGRQLEMRYLGDWEVEEVEYGGGTVHLYHLLAGLRRDDGSLGMVRLALDAPDLEPRHMTNFWCHYKGESSVGPRSGVNKRFFLEELPEWLRPGEVVGVTIREPASLDVGLITPAGSRAPAEWNYVQFVMTRTLYNTRPEAYQLTAAEKAAYGSRDWPDRVVTLALPDGPGVRRASERDCEP